MSLKGRVSQAALACSARVVANSLSRAWLSRRAASLSLHSAASASSCAKSIPGRRQSAAPGSKVTVALRKGAVVDALPLGRLKVKGAFASAPGSSIALQRKNGQSITIDKGSVRRVCVRIPLDRRTKGWIGTAVAFGAVQAFLSFGLDSDDLTPNGFAQARGGFTVPAAIFLLRRFGTREVYNLPSR